jgi:hypothetical protein
MLAIMVKCVCYTGFWIHWFRDPGVAIPNGLVTIRRTSLVGVDHSRSNLFCATNVMYGMLCNSWDTDIVL